MTGQELIDYIKENHAESMNVMIVDTDGFLHMERYEPDVVEIEHYKDTEILVIY